MKKHTRPLTHDTEMFGENSVANPEDSVSVDRGKYPLRSKRPGRQRLDAPGASVLSQERRNQLRQAQKVHRAKQKVILHNATVRVSELEAQIEKIRDAFANLENDADASVSRPAIYERLNKLRAAIFLPQSENPGKSPAASEMANHNPPPGTCEYVASRKLLLRPGSTNRPGGTHSPPKDEFGNAIYPPNRRITRRVLGSMAIADRSLDGDTDFHQQKVLKTFGLGGQWFDCRDVEGYLSERGVSMKQHCALPKISGRKADRILYLDLFCRKLLHSTVILGRVPGFYKTDVEYTFASSLHRDISSPLC